MIHQTMPRKGYEDCHIEENKGFFIEGKDYADCIEQLKEWAKRHPEKWIYYHDCGMGASKLVPVARNIFEVEFFDFEPAASMLLWDLFQKGREDKREINTMSKEERNELITKQLKFFYTLGSSFRKNGG